MTKYGTPSGSCPKSVIWTTLGWFTLAVARASWMKRAGEVGVRAPGRGGATFMAKRAIERGVAHLVDAPHAALAEELDDLVAAVDDASDERIARGDRRRRLEPAPSNGQNTASREKRCPHAGHRVTSRRMSTVLV